MSARTRPRQRRHKLSTVAMARRMYGDGDSWQPTEIARYLAGQGTPVSVTTVRCWVVPGMAEQQRQWNAASYGRRRSSAERQLARMVELRRTVGLTCSAIARLIRHEFGVSVSEVRVRVLVGSIPRGGG